MEILSVRARTVNGSQASYLPIKETEACGSCGNLCRVTWLESHHLSCQASQIEVLITIVQDEEENVKQTKTQRLSADSSDEDGS